MTSHGSVCHKSWSIFVVKNGDISASGKKNGQTISMSQDRFY